MTDPVKGSWVGQTFFEGVWVWARSVPPRSGSQGRCIPCLRILPMYLEIMIPFKKENNPPSRPPKPGPSQAQPSWGWESLFCSDFYSHRGRAGAEVLMTRGRPACAVVPCGWAPGPGTRVIRHCQQRGAPRPHTQVPQRRTSSISHAAWPT